MSTIGPVKMVGGKKHEPDQEPGYHAKCFILMDKFILPQVVNRGGGRRGGRG